MSEGKATPGPWRAFERPVGIEILCGDRHAPDVMPSAGIRVADVRYRRVGRGGRFAPSTSDKANAALIAAAPDMREYIDEQADIIDILIQRLVEADLVDDMDRVKFNQWSHDYQKIVAKAEGRS